MTTNRATLKYINEYIANNDIKYHDFANGKCYIIFKNGVTQIIEIIKGDL